MRTACWHAVNINMATPTPRLATNLQRLTNLLHAITAALGDVQPSASCLDRLGVHKNAWHTLLQLISRDVKSVEACLPRMLGDGKEVAEAALHLMTARRLHLEASMATLAALDHAMRTMLSVPSQLVDSRSPIDNGMAEIVFFNLWDLACSISCFHSNHLPLLNRFLGKEISAMQPLISTRMLWLLHFLRSDSPALHTVRLNALPDTTWQKGALKLLAPAVMHLEYLCKLAAPEMHIEMCALPSGYVSTLCSLSCELLHQQNPHSLPPHEVTTVGGRHDFDFTHRIMGLWSQIITTYCSLGISIAVHPEIVCPAAVEMAKLAVLDSCSNSQVLPQISSVMQRTLSVMLHEVVLITPVSPTTMPPKNMLLPSSSTSSPPPTAALAPAAQSPLTSWSATPLQPLLSLKVLPPDDSSNSTPELNLNISIASPPMGDPEAGPHVFVPTPRFLSVLHQHTLANPNSLALTTALMANTMLAWRAKNITSTAATTTCLSSLLHHCSQHVKYWMGRHKRSQLQGQLQARSMLSPLNTQEMMHLTSLLLTIDVCAFDSCITGEFARFVG